MSLTIESIRNHWKKQGGKLRGYSIDFVKLYERDGIISIGIDGPKAKLQMDAFDKIKQMFSKCTLAGGAGYIGVGRWRDLRPSIYVDIPIDAELIDLKITRRK